MVTACAINALLHYCARRTHQSTLPSETLIMMDGLGPGLVEEHGVDAQEYLQKGTAGGLNTLELYLMLFTASRRIRLYAPELLDVLIILNSAVTGSFNLSPKTMRITLAASIVLAATRTQAAPSAASTPSEMNIASSAFPHLNLSRVIGSILLLDRAVDFKHAVSADEQLRRKYTINLAKLAERERPVISMYLQRVPRMALDTEANTEDTHGGSQGVMDRPTAGVHSPARIFKRARPLDGSRLSQQLLCDL